MITNPFCSLSLTITFLWMGTIHVQAEVYGPPGDFGWRKSVPLHLILHAAVISDLGLTDEVAGKLQNLQRRVQGDIEEALAQARSSDDPKTRIYLPKELVGKNLKILHTIRIKYAEQIDGLLTTGQQMRLHQIHLQYGTFASDARLFGLGRINAIDNADVLSDSGAPKNLS